MRRGYKASSNCLKAFCVPLENRLDRKLLSSSLLFNQPILCLFLALFHLPSSSLRLEWSNNCEQSKASSILCAFLSFVCYRFLCQDYTSFCPNVCVLCCYSAHTERTFQPGRQTNYQYRGVLSRDRDRECKYMCTYINKPNKCNNKSSRTT